MAKITENEAAQILIDWEESHPGEGLINGKAVTSLGARAVERLLCYDFADVRRAVDDADLNSGRFKARFGAVFTELHKVAPPRAEHDSLPGDLVDLAGLVLRINKGRAGDYTYGIIDPGDPPVLYMLRERSFLGHPQKPEWVAVIPDSINTHRVTPLDPLESRHMKEKWWGMEQRHDFASIGPQWLYWTHDGPQRTAAECLRMMKGFLLPTPRGGEPAPLKTLISPMGLEYVPGSNIGAVVAEDDPLPF